MFECVYQRVEASKEQASAEQDLSAQQRAATSSLASAVVALLTLIVSSVGVWFVKRTLDATLQAVEDTSKATKAMGRQNEIIEANQRPFLAISFSEPEFLEEYSRTYMMGCMGEDRYENFIIYVSIINVGTTPAYDISGDFCLGWHNQDNVGLNRQSFTMPILGPGTDKKQKLFCAVPLDRTDFSVIGLINYKSHDLRSFFTNSKWIQSDRSKTMTAERAFIPSENAEDHKRN